MPIRQIYRISRYIAAIVLASALSVSADTIVDWDFSGIDHDVDQGASETSASGATILDAIESNAVAGIVVSDLVGGGSLQWSSGTVGAATPADGESNLKNWGYIEFTIDADVAGTLNIDSISITEYRNGAAAPTTMGFQINVDGGGFVTYDATQADGEQGVVNYKTFTFTESILAADTAVIRFTPTGGAGGNLHINALSVEGSVDEIDPTVAYYRFDNDGIAAGNTAPANSVVIDESAYANHGAAKNGPSYSSDVASSFVPLTGAPNTLSLDLGGSGIDHVIVPDDDSLDFGDNSFTIEASVKLDVAPTGTANRQYLLWKKRTDGVTDAFVDYGVLFASGNSYGATGAGELVLVRGDGVTQANIGSGLFLTDTSGWHDVSVSFDALNNLVRFILDGQVSIVSTSFIASANDGALTIGGHFNATSGLTSFDGLIDELRISEGYLNRFQLLTVPAPAALPAGLAMLGLVAARRRRNR